MQILGLYTYTRLRHRGCPRNILKTLKELHNAQLFFPIILSLENTPFSTVPDCISIFPAFYSVNRRATIPQVLAQSFCKDGMYVRRKVNILELSIYLINSSDMPSVYKLAKDMAVSFPQIRWLNLWFEFRCEIVSFLLTVDDYNST